MIFLLICISPFGAGMPNPGEHFGFDLTNKEGSPQNYKKGGGVPDGSEVGWVGLVQIPGLLVMTVLPSFLGIAFCLHGTPLFLPSLQSFLCCTSTLGWPSRVAVPTAFPGIRFSSPSRRVMSATTSPCGTLVASESSDP